MNFLAVVLLSERHAAENRREDHAGCMNPHQVAVQLDRAFGLHAWNFGSGDRVVRREAIQSRSTRSKRGMQVDSASAGRNRWPSGIGSVAFGFGTTRDDHRSAQRNDSDETQRLMHLEVVRPLIEFPLQIGVGHDLLRRKAEITKGGSVARLRLVRSLIRILSLVLALAWALILLRCALAICGNGSIRKFLHDGRNKGRAGRCGTAGKNDVRITGSLRKCHHRNQDQTGIRDDGSSWSGSSQDFLSAFLR